jgi:hypothetical protein
MLGPLKLIYNIPDGTTFLYDLAADPVEDHDIAASRPEDVQKLRYFIKRDILVPADHERTTVAPHPYTSKALDMNSRVIQ